MKTIVEYLENLGLSEAEAKLYLTLLETGPISVRDLATATGIKRTTAYLYIDQLVAKGLLIRTVKGSQKLVAANEPNDTLEYLVKQKLEKAKSAQTELPEILTKLSSTYPQIKDVGDAEIKYYKGKLGVKKIYEEVLKTTELRSYVNIEEIAHVFPENFPLFDKALKENHKMVMYEIVENSLEAKKRFDNAVKRERYHYKFLPENMKLTAQDILIYDNKVAIIHFKDNIDGIVMQNVDLYNNFKLLFDFIWKVLPRS